MPESLSLDPTPKSLRILLADDNRLMVEGLTNLLVAHGMEVVGIAGDGLKAVELAQTLHPDLILMDLQLPIMNGFCAAQEIKSDPATASVRIVALTAHAMAEERQRAEQLGFDGYITKPVNTRTFPAELRQILDGDALHD